MLLSLGMAVLTLVAAALVVSYFPSVARRLRWRYGPLIGPAIAVLATLLIAADHFDNESKVGFGLLLGSALNGVAFGWFFLAWGVVYSAYRPKRASLHLFASFALGAIVYLLIVSLQPMQAVVATVLLPLISGAAYLFNASHPSVPDGNELTRSDINGQIKMPWRLIAGVGIYGAVMGTMKGMVPTGEAVGFTSTSASFIGVGAIALMALFVSFVARSRSFDRGRGFRLWYRLVLPLAVAGFLLSSVSGNNGSTWGVANALVTVGFLSLDMLMWSTIITVASQTPIRRTATIAWGRAAVMGGALLGVSVGALLGSRAVSAPDIYRLGSLVTVLVIVMTTSFILRESDLIPAHKERSEQTSETTAFEALVEPYSEQVPQLQSRLVAEFASQYALSERETDVMELLLRGRDTLHIQSALYISRGTINTHRGSIYRKMAVSSQQELIDLYEEWQHKSQVVHTPPSHHVANT